MSQAVCSTRQCLFRWAVADKVTRTCMHMAVLMQAAPGLAGLYDSLTTSVDAVMGTGVSRALGTRVFMLFCLALSACYCIIMGICITCLT